jgi:ADP-L-glycero-D-manno-heptose 6-epimerase
MIIVTGGAGFIGSAFIKKLNSENISDILVVDDIQNSSKWKNLVNLKFSDYLNKGDFLAQIKANKIKKVTALIHMGACSSTTENNMDFLLENNYRYTQILAQWSLKNKVKFIYASSAATYGNGEKGFSDDQAGLTSLTPINQYGYSKHIFDLWALRENLLGKIIGIKFFNVFGPNEYHKDDMRSMVCKAYEQIQSTGKIKLFKSYHPKYPDGGQMRDFVYIKDCVDIMWWLLKSKNVYGLYNLGTGQARTWNDLAKAIFSALKIKENIEYIEMPENIKPQYQYFTEAKMQKIQNAGLNHKFSTLEESVQDYVQNYLIDQKYL